MNDFTILLLALKVNLSQHLIHESSVIIRCEYNFLYAQADCPADTMLRQTRLISDRTSDKTFL